VKALDRCLQKQRINKVRGYIKPGEKVLDVGCGADPVLLKSLPTHLGVGVDPTAKESVQNEKLKLYQGYFPDALPEIYRHDFFDKIIFLAVLEHIPENKLNSFCEACYQALRHQGQLLLTVPDKKVDYILEALKFAHLIDGMSLEEHHGYDTRQTESLFKKFGFNLDAHIKFQWGLNNLFVFRKS
jgi:2-polyprenyl-3-methyl-5-hydroxy-6-metoxy-1,4-benzoquinol methylase